MSKSSYKRARTLTESIQNALEDHLRFKARSVHDYIQLICSLVGMRSKLCDCERFIPTQIFDVSHTTAEFIRGDNVRDLLSPIYTKETLFHTILAGTLVPTAFAELT